MYHMDNDTTDDVGLPDGWTAGRTVVRYEGKRYLIWGVHRLTRLPVGRLFKADGTLSNYDSIIHYVLDAEVIGDYEGVDRDRP